MVEYLVRIVTAYALLRLASLVVKDTEGLLRASHQATPARPVVEEPVYTEDEITEAAEE